MNLLKSLAAVSSMTMFSRVLGFARDAIVARVFGAGMATDAFFVAFKLPNLLRRIFAEGAFSQAFVPILAEYKSKQGEDATRVFVAYVSGLLTLALAIVTVLGMLAAPWVIMVTAPGFADTADKFALTSQLLRITFPYILYRPQQIKTGSRIAAQGCNAISFNHHLSGFFISLAIVEVMRRQFVGTQQAQCVTHIRSSIIIQSI